MALEQRITQMVGDSPLQHDVVTLTTVSLRSKPWNDGRGIILH